MLSVFMLLYLMFLNCTKIAKTIQIVILPLSINLFFSIFMVIFTGILKYFIKMTNSSMVVLFDFDGVIMDTETHYTNFWDSVGEKYLNKSGFGMTVKGQSLKLIYGKYFTGEFEKLIPEMTEMIDDMELNMTYEYVPGAKELIVDLKKNGIRMAIVTSSDDRKMDLVYKQHPDLPGLFDYIVTANQFTHSKPHPECYQIAMLKLNVKPNQAVVFEDSIYGIKSGTDAGAFVVGVATTNGREQIEGITNHVIDDFTEMDALKLKSIITK